MPKQSRESIVAELDARKVGYTDEMSYNELNELLKKAQDEQKVKEKPQAIDYSNVRCGLSTIHDHEKRIVMIERELIEIRELCKGRE